MKKTILLNVILIISFVLMIVALVFIINLSNVWNIVGDYVTYVRPDILDKARELDFYMYYITLPIALISIATAIDFATLIVIDIPLIKKLFTRKN